MSDITSETQTAASVKAGARHNKSDQERINKWHRAADELKTDMAELGAAIEDAADPAKTLIAFGDEVKALGSGKVGGYLIRFSAADDPDLTGDYFTSATDFGPHDRTPVLYHHGLDKKLGPRVLAEGEIKQDSIGVWVESQLALRDEYEQAIYRMAERGKLGWSSGTASHLVQRRGTGEITAWPLGLDASLTPTPAEPRNVALTLKAYYLRGTAGQPAPDGATAITESHVVSTQGVTIMADTANTAAQPSAEYKALNDALAALTAKLGEVEIKLNAPALPPTGTITQVHDLAAERPFASFGEQLQAIKAATINPSVVDKRLLEIQARAIKATGASEGAAVDGGFLVQQDFTNEISSRIYSTGTLLSRVTRRPLGANSNGIVVNTINETSRVDGSRFGGVRAYWLNEGGTKTASRPTMRRFKLDLEKLTGLYYATDELLQDAVALGPEVSDMFGKELQFEAEKAIYRGDGAGKPQGLMQSPALVSVAKETGQAAATIVYANLLKMWQRLWSPLRSQAVWFVNQDTEPQLHSLALPVGTAALEPRFVNYAPDGMLTIFGRPVIPVEYAATLGTQGDIMLTNLAEYRWIEKSGIQSASSIHVQFTTDETAFRWVWRVNGAPFWNAALTPYQGTNTLSHVVVLDTRA